MANSHCGRFLASESKGKRNVRPVMVPLKRCRILHLNTLIHLWNSVDVEDRELPFSTFSKKMKERFLFEPTPYRIYTNDEENDLIDWIGEARIKI